MTPEYNPHDYSTDVNKTKTAGLTEAAALLRITEGCGYDRDAAGRRQLTLHVSTFW